MTALRTREASCLAQYFKTSITSESNASAHATASWMRPTIRSPRVFTSGGHRTVHRCRPTKAWDEILEDGPDVSAMNPWIPSPQKLVVHFTCMSTRGAAQRKELQIIPGRPC